MHTIGFKFKTTSIIESIVMQIRSKTREPIINTKLNVNTCINSLTYIHACPQDKSVLYTALGTCGKYSEKTSF